MKPPIYKFAFWAWFGLVLLSSFFSAGWISRLNDPNNTIRSDYFLHFIVFFVFPLIGWYSTRNQQNSKQFYLLMLVCVFLAVASEFIQKHVHDRTFNPMDMLANILGIIVGVILISLIKSTKNHFTNQG